MAVPARVICDVFMGAVFAACDVTAKRSRPAALDGAHHLQLVKADVPFVRGPIRSTMGTEDIRNLQIYPSQGGLRRAFPTLLALGLS